MKNTLETRLGIFFALALLAAFIILEMLGGIDFLKKGYHVHALFSNIQELKVGDPVKMAGVQIGRVEAIALTNDKVRVSLKLNKDTQVRTDSKAAIKFTGLLGQNFVAIDFGTPNGRPAAEGTYLTTQEQPDLSTLMAKLENVATGVENLTKSFSGDTINNLMGPFTDFLKENGPRLGVLIGNMQNISTQVAQGKGTVGKLLYEDALYLQAMGTLTNAQDVASEMKLTLSNARGIVDKANSVMDQVNSGQGTLGKLVKDDKLYSESTTAMTNLREIFEKMNKGQGSVGQLINDDSFLKNAKMSLQKLDKAAEGLEDTGPLSVLGTAVNSLF